MVPEVPSTGQLPFAQALMPSTGSNGWAPPQTYGPEVEIPITNGLAPSCAQSLNTFPHALLEVPRSAQYWAPCHSKTIKT